VTTSTARHRGAYEPRQRPNPTLAKVRRTWTSDGSSNVMLLSAAVANLRFRIVRESHQAVTTRYPGLMLDEAIAEALLEGAELATPHATFKLEG